MAGSLAVDSGGDIARAISRPRSFSAVTMYSTPSACGSRATSCGVAAICGLHFGFTKAPTLMRRMPAPTSRRATSSFSSSVMPGRSIWKPSRRVSSVIRTRG